MCVHTHVSLVLVKRGSKPIRLWLLPNVCSSVGACYPCGEGDARACTFHEDWFVTKFSDTK